MLKSSLCDYGDVFILVKGTITSFGQGADTKAVAAGRNNKEVIFKNCALFTDCISETNNTLVDNAKDQRIKQKLFKNIRRFMAILQR